MLTIRAGISGPAASWLALAGLLHEPAHGALGGPEDRDVPVVRPWPELGRRRMTGQPFGLRAGHDAVLAALQVQDRRAYLAGIEAPGGDVGQVVVDRPADAAFDGLPGNLAQPGPGTRERGVIGRRELLRVERGGCEVLLQRGPPLGRGAQFGRADRVHAVEPAQAP